MSRELIPSPYYFLLAKPTVRWSIFHFLLTEGRILPEILSGLLIWTIFAHSFFAHSYELFYESELEIPGLRRVLLWIITTVSMRILWNSAVILHGLGHSLMRVALDRDLSAFRYAEVLEHRSVASVVMSCGLLQPIFLPAWRPENLPSVVVGDSTPWKIRGKALAGPLLNTLAALAGWWVYQTWSVAVDRGAVCWWVALQYAAVLFAVANGIILVSSVSDMGAVATGEADRFYCGNFGVIARKTDPELQGLIPQRWLDLFKTMGRETEVRGEQAGGGLTLAQDWSGRTYFVGDKIVNAKRSNLTASLESTFYRTRDRAWRAGLRPCHATITGVWHYRFGTSGPPAVLETHWHEWSPAHLETVWQVKNGQWTASLQNVNHRITHNGDFEAWQIFGQLVDYKTLGLWLERVLQVPNQTIGDSPKIAGMLDLLATQGMWLPSVRLAYQLMVASSIANAFGSEPPAKQAPNMAPSRSQLAHWAKLCEAAFVEQIHHLGKGQELKTPESLYQLEQAIIRNLQQEAQLASLDDCKFCLFVKATVQGFLHNDLYRATQFFMLRARGSFGLVTISTLAPDKLVLSSLGQPITIGVDPQQQYSIYGSEPSAVDAVLMHQPETYRLDLNQNAGEIAVLSPTRLAIYSMTENRELRETEIIPRRVPYEKHPYLQRLPKQAHLSADLIEKDLQDIPQILRTIRDTWMNPTSLNRQSAEHLLNLLMAKAKYLAEKQEKLKFLELDPALAESRHVDILITGVENSLWLGERFAKDLKTIFPLLSIKTLSSNRVLHQLQHDFDSLGLARQSIVFAISQSGQTFSTRQVLHASDLLVRQGVIREFFVLTGEPTSFIGSALARPIYPGEPFSRRLFTNKSGRRLAEPATASVAATHQTLTELLFYLTRQMQLAFPNQPPFGLTLSPEELLVLQSLENEFFMQSVVDIVGANSQGQEQPNRVHRQIVNSGRHWALHITEAPLAWGIHALYILISVGWAIPFGYSIPLAQTLVKGVLMATQLSSTSSFANLLLAGSTLVDIGIYIFGAWLWTLGLRLLQKRQLLARTGKRTLVIGDVAWVQQLLRIYVSKLFSLSYGITSLEIHGANPQDHLVHQFGHRVVRGTLLFFGFPDGRCSEKQRNEENAVLMTARQASGIQHLGHGPEVIAVGSNPMLTQQGFANAMVLPSPTHQTCKDGERPPLTNNLIETLRESRFGSFRRLLASYVFFWAMAKRVASFPLLHYTFWRSQSRTKIMTTAAPVSATNLDRPEQEEVSILDLPTLANREQS
jgi:hypothetical protein